MPYPHFGQKEKPRTASFWRKSVTSHKQPSSSYGNRTLSRQPKIPIRKEIISVSCVSFIHISYHFLTTSKKQTPELSSACLVSKFLFSFALNHYVTPFATGYHFAYIVRYRVLVKQDHLCVLWELLEILDKFSRCHIIHPNR